MRSFSSGFCKCGKMRGVKNSSMPSMQHGSVYLPLPVSAAAPPVENAWCDVVHASSAVPGLTSAPCQPARPLFFLPLRGGLTLSATCLLWAGHTGRDRIGRHSTFGVCGVRWREVVM